MYLGLDFGPVQALYYGVGPSLGLYLYLNQLWGSVG